MANASIAPRARWESARFCRALFGSGLLLLGAGAAAATQLEVRQAGVLWEGDPIALRIGGPIAAPLGLRFFVLCDGAVVGEANLAPGSSLLRVESQAPLAAGRHRVLVRSGSFVGETDLVVRRRSRQAIWALVLFFSVATCAGLSAALQRRAALA